MKFNKWTLGLAALGVVSLASVVQAEEKSSPILTSVSSTTISGYVDTSAIWKLGNNSSRAAAGAAGILGRSFDAGKNDGFNLNVVKLTIEKPLDEAQWAAGYKADLLFGPDAVGWNTSANSLAGLGGTGSDFALKQAYVALRAPVGNGLDFKMGVFDCPIGYEVFEAGNNPNYSRSFGFGLESAQLTGLLASYKFSDLVSATAGIANTVSTGINARAARAGAPAPEAEKTLCATISLTAPESLGFLKGSTLSAGVINGLAAGGAANQRDTTGIYVGATLNTPVTGLTLGAAWDYKEIRDRGLAFAPEVAEYAVAGYVAFQATEKFKIATRADFYNGEPATGTFAYATAYPTDGNKLFAATATFDYSLWANVISRVELRWDHDLESQKNGFGPYGFDDNNAYTVALNVIYKF